MQVRFIFNENQNCELFSGYIRLGHVLEKVFREKLAVDLNAKAVGQLGDLDARLCSSGSFFGGNSGEDTGQQQPNQSGFCQSLEQHRVTNLGGPGEWVKVKPELRNPNSRNPKEARNSKAEIRLCNRMAKVVRSQRAERSPSGFGLRISFESRIADFGFRI